VGTRGIGHRIVDVGSPRVLGNRISSSAVNQRRATVPRRPGGRGSSLLGRITRSMLGIAPICIASIRRGGPGGAGVMVIDELRAMFATLPSKRTGEAIGAVVIRIDCPIPQDRCGDGPSGGSDAM